jgi:hypothetical protein
VLGSFSEEVRLAIAQMRPGKDGWGSVTIHTELRISPAFSGVSLPSVRSIDRYLSSRCLVEGNWLPAALPSDPVPLPRFAHDLWQMDAEGNKRVPDLGFVGMLNIKDVFSKAYTMTYPHRLGSPSSHLKQWHYQFGLRLAFTEVGMCHRLQVDHESVFFDNSSLSPYPTPFHRWALGMNFPLVFTPKAKPFRQGAVERSHQTMHRQVCAGRTYSGHEALFQACQKRRQRLNNDIPCRQLDNRPPFKAFPEAVRSDRPYDHAKEEAYFDQQRIFDYLDANTWARAVSHNHTFSMGGQQYFLSAAKPNSTLQIRFDRKSKLFECLDTNQNHVGFLKPKGISFKELAGNLAEFQNWMSKYHHLLHLNP